METGNSPRVRGTVIKVPDASPGILFINGQQRPFILDSTWKSPVAPTPNMTVDVDLDQSNSITGIAAVDPHQLSKEKMNQLSNTAQEQGKQAAELAKKGIGALAARMGTIQLVAAVAVVIGVFFLPTISVAGGFGGGLSLTFWNALGFDPSAGPLGGGGGFGFWNLLCLVCIAAPFAVPFVKDPRAKFGNAAPLAILLITWLRFYYDMSQLQKAAGPLGDAISSAFSYGFGIYLIAIAGLVLAAFAFMVGTPAKTN